MKQWSWAWIPCLVVMGATAMIGAAQGQVAGEGTYVLPVQPVTIDCTGKASVEVTPDYVEFWIDARPAGSSFAEAMKTAIDVEPAVRKELDDRTLAPIDIKVFGPTIPDVKEVSAHVAIQLRFSTAPFTQSGDGPLTFAALCDGLRAVAEKLGGTLRGPVTGVTNRKPLEQAALGKAVEAAYPHGEGIADILLSQIVSVEQVRVAQVAWDKPTEAKTPKQDLRRSVCTVSVRVTYAVTPIQP